MDAMFANATKQSKIPRWRPSGDLLEAGRTREASRVPEHSPREGRIRPPRQLPVPIRVLAGLMLMSMAGCAGTLVEVLASGPYTTWFNDHRRDIVIQAGLIGAPESRALALLGPPTKVSDVSPRDTGANGTVTLVGKPYRCFTYRPHPWLPFAGFRLFSEEGVVTSYRTFAD